MIYITSTKQRDRVGTYVLVCVSGADRVFSEEEFLFI
jgi:hypothetical protein